MNPEITTTFAPTSMYFATTNHSYNTTTEEKCERPMVGSVSVVLQCVFLLIILFSSVVGNGVVIISVFLSKKLKGRSTFFFVGSLGKAILNTEACAFCYAYIWLSVLFLRINIPAVSNAIMAISYIPFNLSIKIHHEAFCLGKSMCFLWFILDVIGNIASILNLLFISLDRFIAIQLPYRYLEYLSKKRCKQIITSIWAFSIIWSISQIINWKKGYISIKIQNSLCVNDNEPFFQVSFFGIFLIVLILISCVYMKILQIALRQIRKSERRITILSANASPDVPVVRSPNIQSENEKRNRRVSKLPCVIKELKTTKSIATVYVVFCICWFPSLFFHMALLIDNTFLFTRPITRLVFVEILPMVTTAINPFIYAFLNKEFRDAVHYIWRKLLVKLKLRDSYLSRKDTARVTYVKSNPNISGLDCYGKLSPLTSNNNSPVCVNKYAE